MTSKLRRKTSKRMVSAQPPGAFPTLFGTGKLASQKTIIAALRSSADVHARALQKQLDIVASLRFRLRNRSKAVALPDERSETSLSAMEDCSQQNRRGEALYTESVAQVLVQLDALKSEVIQRIDDSSHELEKKLERLAAILDQQRPLSQQNQIQQLQGSQGQQSTPSCETVCGRSRKRNSNMIDEVPLLNLVADKEAASTHLMRCAMMLTVFCFGKAVPGAMKWTNERMERNLSSADSLARGVSGFSLLFFSVTNEDSKARFKTRMGKLWSWMGCTVIMTLVAQGRHEAFVLPGRAQPNWLSQFGSGRGAKSFIAEVVESMEQCALLPHARAAAKRRRLNNLESGGEAQNCRTAREQAVGVLRSLLLRILSAGRTEARLHIYRNVLFLVEKIRTFDSVSAAKEDGYEFVFHEPVDEDERGVPDDIENTVWDVPVAKVGRADDLDVKDENSNMYSTLCSSFRSLKLTLRFKKKVRCGPLDCVEGSEELRSGEQFWPVEEEVVLHRVALGVLVGSFKAKDHHEVLRSSTQSLRTVHIFAVALKALVLKALGKELSAHEQSALGAVTFQVLERGQDLATVMIGGRSDRERNSEERTQLGVERVRKFEISWQAYNNAKARVDAERAENEEAEENEVEERDNGVVALRQETDPGGEDDEFDCSWMIGTEGM